MPIAVSSLPQNVLQFLRHPAALSVTASLGVHGLVWLSSPFIPLEDSTAATGPLTVDVVQLSPEELSRLPQDATAFFNPLQSPLTPSTGLSGLGPESSLPSIPELPPLPPPPADIFGTLPSLESLSSLPSIPPADSSLIAPPGALPPPPLTSSLETFDPSQLPPLGSVSPPQPIDLSTLPPFPPGTIPSLPPYPQNPDPNLTPPTPDPSVPAVETPRAIPQAALDRLRELQRLQRLQAQNPGTSLDPTLPRQAQDWLARAGSPPRRLIFDNVPYPKSACPEKGYVTVTASVDSQGQVTRAEITKSSNISDFDEIALKAAKAHTYEASADGQPTTYWIPFDFDPKVACSGKVTPSPTATPTKPATTPTPPQTSVSPKPGKSATPTPSSTPTPNPARSQPGEKPEENSSPSPTATPTAASPQPTSAPSPAETPSPSPSSSG